MLRFGLFFAYFFESLFVLTIKKERDFMKKFLSSVGVLVAIFFASSFVYASTMVTQWEYTNSAVFTSWTETTGGINDVRLEDGGKRLLWGSLTDTNNQSYLQFSDPVSGNDLVTGGFPKPVVSFMHQNRSIDARFDTLTSALITATIEFSPFLPNNLISNFVFTSSIDFYFFETPNQINNQPSPTANDIFVLKDPTATLGSFVFDGYTYSFSFLGDGFSNIADKYGEVYSTYISNNLPAGSNVNAPYIGWVTTEGQFNTAQFYVSISAVPNPIPEPSTMLLLGAGLLGLGAVARRRRAN